MNWRGLAALSGLSLFAVLMAWLDYHGYFISPDAIYIDVLAKSFWDSPYIIYLKRAYSYPYEIIHPDFNFPFLLPLWHWLLASLGVETWHRGNWTTAFFMGMTVTAWIWALRPHFETSGKTESSLASARSLMAGWVATLLLFAQAQNQMWHELYLGIGSPIAVFLFVVSYGAYVRERYWTCGLVTGLAFLVRFDAQVTMAVYVAGHLVARAPDVFSQRGSIKVAGTPRSRAFSRALVECGKIALGFLIVTSPWWIRAMYYGKAPWFNHMVPIFLYGEAGNFRWFPDTDTGIGHPITSQPPYIFYEELVRRRFYDLVIPYFGVYLSELFSLGFLIFGGIAYAVRRPRSRALVAFIMIGAVVRIAVVAGLVDSFNRRYLLILDAAAITWITLMLWDGNRWVRHAAKAVALLLVVANWGDLTNVLKSMRPYVGYLEANSPGVSAAVAELDTEAAPVLARQIEGHAIAYYTSKIPIIELPINYKDEGILDAFFDRFGITWATAGEDYMPHLKRFTLERRIASNGYSLWRVVRK